MKKSTLLVSVLVVLASLTLLPMATTTQAAPKRARRAEAKKAIEAKPERSLRVFTLKNASATGVTKTILPLFQASAESRVVIVSDQRTNSIIARGLDAELKVLEALLIQLDEPVDTDKPK